MKKVPTWTSWGLVVAAISLSPIVLIFGLPLAVGIGLDIFDRYGEGPIVLALCVPVAFALLREISARGLPGRLAAFFLRSHVLLGHHSAKPN